MPGKTIPGVSHSGVGVRDSAPHRRGFVHSTFLLMTTPVAFEPRFGRRGRTALTSSATSETLEILHVNGGAYAGHW
jgi:hypothetical protein